MRACGLLLILAGCVRPADKGAPAAAAIPAAGVPPPNIVLIYTDDHGYADLGSQGVNRDVRTPQLDAFAADGVRCTRGYVSAPQCVPSRAGLLTGRYQQRFGVEDNLQGPLPLEEVTIAERLATAGYVCGQVGKWHLEQLPERRQRRDGVEPDARDETEPLGRHNLYLPRAQGFSEYFCGATQQYVASHDLQGRPLRDAPELVTDRRCRIEVQTEAALSFVRRHSQQPFFLYLAYFAPHVPLESPEPWFSQTSADLPLERRQALAMLAAVDDGVGQLRALLRELQLEQQTLLFFISDNGAPLKAGAWDGSLNDPWVGEKGMLTDGGLRVPFLVAWPGRLPAGRVYDRPVLNLDVAATALAAAGLPAPPELDGFNLLPLLDGSQPDPPARALFWRWRSQAAVLADGWKLMRLGDQQEYLFDLESEAGERHNRIADEPVRAAELRRQLSAWSAGLEPPGLPQRVNPQDARFFEEHLPEAAATESYGQLAPPQDD